MDWRFHRSLNLLLVFIGALILGASHAWAYPTPVDFDGVLQRWDISPEDPVVRYEIEAEEGLTALHEEIIAEAAQMWTDVPSSYVALVAAEEGEVPTITIKIKSAFDGGGFSSGFAVFDGKDNSGKPTHCTIEISSGEAIGYLSFAKTILHELGHCLGLGHSLIPEAIMGYSLEKNNYELDTDDMAAISRLYPADGSEPELPLGCSIGTVSSRSHPMLMLLLMLPVLLGLIVKGGRVL